MEMNASKSWGGNRVTSPSNLWELSGHGQKYDLGPKVGDGPDGPFSRKNDESRVIFLMGHLNQVFSGDKTLAIGI